MKIEQKGQKLEPPYECDPTDNDPSNAVKIFISETESFDVPCKCALDGEKGKVKNSQGVEVETASRGYSGSILGLPEYADALFYVKEMIFTNRCHTLDKENASSKFDTCATVAENILRDAIQKNFEVQNWPYSQTYNVKKCFERMSRDSWFTLNKYR